MGKKILICDDDEAILEVIKIMLENAGYEVIALFSGRAIQKKVKQILPDLILIDIWMPGIDGKEAIKLLKHDKETQSIPIVIISALHRNEISAIVKDVGADAFLPKPFEMQDLLSIAEKYAV